MSNKALIVVIAMSGLAIGWSSFGAEESVASRQDLRVSVEVRNLLRAEMREIATWT